MGKRRRNRYAPTGSARMNRHAIVAALPLILLAIPLASPLAIAAKKKPAPKPTATPAPTPTEAPPAPPEKKPAAKVEFGACPSEALNELDSEALVTFLHKRCRNLRVPENAAPTDLGNDETLVAICTREKEAIETKECHLKAHVEPAGEEGAASVALSSDGDLAIALKTSKLEKSAKPANGALMTLVVSASGDDAETKTAKSPLVWRKSQDPYGKGNYIWFPMPMFTTDFSAGPNGYRFGLSPIALAFGTRIYPSKSRSYFGISAFAAWNVLIPNDTQTLSNGTTVRINYKAAGFGVLLDASGYVSLGVGVGKTFTTDSRTDFRTWIYFGPRLLGFLTDFN